MSELKKAKRKVRFWQIVLALLTILTGFCLGFILMDKLK